MGTLSSDAAALFTGNTSNNKNAMTNIGVSTSGSENASLSAAIVDHNPLACRLCLAKSNTAGSNNNSGNAAGVTVAGIALPIAPPVWARLGAADASTHGIGHPGDDKKYVGETGGGAAGSDKVNVNVSSHGSSSSSVGDRVTNAFFPPSSSSTMTNNNAKSRRNSVTSGGTEVGSGTGTGTGSTTTTTMMSTDATVGNAKSPRSTVSTTAGGTSVVDGGDSHEGGSSSNSSGVSAAAAQEAAGEGALDGSGNGSGVVVGGGVTAGRPSSPRSMFLRGNSMLRGMNSMFKGTGGVGVRSRGGSFTATGSSSAGGVSKDASPVRTAVQETGVDAGGSGGSVDGVGGSNEGGVAVGAGQDLAAKIRMSFGRFTASGGREVGKEVEREEVEAGAKEQLPKKDSGFSSLFRKVSHDVILSESCAVLLFFVLFFMRRRSTYVTRKALGVST